MKPFQIFNSMVDHLDLFFHHRHSPGKMVMLSYFPGKFLYFCFHNRLGFAVGNQYANQCDAAGDHRSHNRFQMFSPPLQNIHMDPAAVDDICIPGSGIRLHQGQQLGSGQGLHGKIQRLAGQMAAV